MTEGHTQEALAAILSRDHKSISAYETGRNSIPDDIAAKLRGLGYDGPINQGLNKDGGIKKVRKSPVNIGQNATSGILLDHISSAWVLVHEACIAAGARPDLMPAKGLGRLLAIVAEKISRGDAVEAREALLEEAKDLVSSMTETVQ